MAVGVAGGWAEEERGLGARGSRRDVPGALLDNAQALAHFHEADHEAVVCVAVGADGDSEVHAVIDVVGVDLADVPGHAGGAEVWSADGRVNCEVSGQGSDAFGADEQDLVLCEEPFELVDVAGYLVQEGAKDGPELLRGVLEDAAGAHVADGDAGAA